MQAKIEEEIQTYKKYADSKYEKILMEKEIEIKQIQEKYERIVIEKSQLFDTIA